MREYNHFDNMNDKVVDIFSDTKLIQCMLMRTKTKQPNNTEMFFAVPRNL